MNCFLIYWTDSLRTFQFFVSILSTRCLQGYVNNVSHWRENMPYSYLSVGKLPLMSNAIRSFYVIHKCLPLQLCLTLLSQLIKINKVSSEVILKIFLRLLLLRLTYLTSDFYPNGISLVTFSQTKESKFR